MRGRQFWWVSLLAAAIDRITKQIALHALPGGEVRVIPDVLSWHLVRNAGAAFSLLSGHGILLVVLTLILIAGVIIFQLRSTGHPKLMRVGLWLIVGGGFGNLWDRVFCDGVIDFIRLDFIRFPIFNLADVCVCIGAGLTVLSMLVCKTGGNADG